MSTNLSKIYSKTPRNNTQPVIKPTETLKDDNKAANRVLAGMKIQNSHMRRLNIDGDIFDVPKMEYVHLLDKQVRDLKQENAELKQKMSKMENNSQKYNHNEYYEIFGEKVIFDSQYLEIDDYVLFYWNESSIRILDCNFNTIMVVDEKSNIITFGATKQDLKDYFSKNNITNINDITEEVEFYLNLKEII